MKITEIRTYLMHAGAPNLRKWAADGSFGTQTLLEEPHGHPQLAVREGLHGRGHHRHRRVLGLAARHRDGGAGPRAPAGRRGPDPYRAALAEDADRHHGPRHDRHGRRRRDDRHRHGAVGHQGQGARRPRLEPARRQGARPHPHLRPRQHARGGAEPEGARLHRLQVRRRLRPRPQGRGAARGRRRRHGHRHRPARPALADARRRRAGVPRAGALSACCGSRTPSRRRTSRASSASATTPACRWPRASARPPSSASAS